MRWGIALLGLAGCELVFPIPAGHPGDGGVGGPANLKISSDAHDFMMVTIPSGTATYTFDVSNSGASPTGNLSASITGNDASMFTTTDGCSGAPLAGGGVCSITVVFTASSSGMKQATLDVSASPGGDVSASLTGTGVAAGALQISPSSYDFKEVGIGTNPTQDFTVMNNTSMTTSVLTMGVIGVDQSSFMIATDYCSTATLDPGAQCTVTVEWTATTLGPKAAQLRASLASGGTPAFASLAGRGVNPESLSASPPSWDFGSWNIPATSPSKTITITNAAGSATTPMLQIGFDDPEFAATTDGCSGTTLAGGASCDVTVAFTAQPLAGAKSAHLVADALMVPLMGTANGGSGETDCLNGIDDDFDGLTDCADPDCQVGYSCLEDAPGGWTGPFELYDGALASAPSCGGAYPTQLFSGDRSPTSPAAKCSVVSCAGTTLSCPGANIAPPSVFSDSACTAGNQQYWGPVTFLTTSCDNSGGVAIISDYPPDPLEQASCSGGSVTSGIMKPAWAWQDEGLACGPLATSAGGCSTGTCAAKPAAPFTGKACVLHVGDVGCPTAPSTYSVKTTYFSNVSDTRTCSPDTTCASSGWCVATWSEYSDGNCSSPIQTNIPISRWTTPSCTVAPGFKSGKLDAAPAPQSGATCAPAAGTPTGMVTGDTTTATTVCCTS
jgi:hypothetical protein